MTATAEIISQRAQGGVLLIPNAALRFTPDTTAEKEASASFVSRLMPKPPATGPQAAVPPARTAFPRSGCWARWQAARRWK
jgi:HlyD family secretion protein